MQKRIFYSLWGIAMSYIFMILFMLSDSYFLLSISTFIMLISLSFLITHIILLLKTFHKLLKTSEEISPAILESAEGEQKQ
jgi:predicted tellurium resistance membrane protein TerC